MINFFKMLAFIVVVFALAMKVGDVFANGITAMAFSIFALVVLATAFFSPGRG